MKGLDWIEKIHFTHDDMLVLGFHGVSCMMEWVDFISRDTFSQANMIVYSAMQNRRLLDIACGGGHRSYAISSLEEVCNSSLQRRLAYFTSHCRSALGRALALCSSNKLRFAMET